MKIKRKRTKTVDEKKEAKGSTKISIEEDKELIN
jgi:hypothetical protein